MVEVDGRPQVRPGQGITNEVSTMPDETSKTERVVLTGASRQARERNGYFRPAAACVRRYEGLDNI